MPQKTSAEIQADIDRLKALKAEAVAREKKEDEENLLLVEKTIGEFVLGIYAGGKSGKAALSDAWPEVDLEKLMENLEAYPDIFARAESLPKDKAISRFKKWAGIGAKKRPSKKSTGDGAGAGGSASGE